MIAVALDERTRLQMTVRYRKGRRSAALDAGHRSSVQVGFFFILFIDKHSLSNTISAVVSVSVLAKKNCFCHDNRFPKPF